MNRTTGLLIALIAVLLGALFYFFAWKPKSDEIAEVEGQIAAVEQQQAQLRTRITELQEIRATAPEVEAAIVAAETVVPRDIALASALRQLQVAADESGVELEAISPARPAQLPDAQPGLASITFTTTANGSYFQIVDFLRRVEDPGITPRGVLWTSLSVAPADYPQLTASMTGAMFALLPTPPAPPAEAPPAEGEEVAEAVQEMSS